MTWSASLVSVASTSLGFMITEARRLAALPGGGIPVDVFDYVIVFLNISSFTRRWATLKISTLSRDQTLIPALGQLWGRYRHRP